METELVKFPGDPPAIELHQAGSTTSPVLKVRKFILHELADLLRGSLAGITGALVLFAYCVSYGALIFQGEFASGASPAIFSFMLSAASGGLIAGSLTKLKPLGYAPDSPVTALLIGLAASVAGSVKADGGSTGESIANALFALWLTGIFSYAIMWMLGYWRVARLFRFVPYSVVAGFLGATGFMLIVAGISLAIRRPFDGWLLASDMTASNLGLVAASAVFAVFLLLFRTLKRYHLLFPVGISLALCFLFLLIQLASPEAAGPALFISTVQNIQPWFPFQLAMGHGIHWGILALHLPQMLAAVIVVQISNVVKISTVEVVRSEAADLDAEFRYNGAGTLAGAALGGIGASISTGVTSAIAGTAGSTRLSGMVAGLLAGSLLLFKINVLTLMPIPVLAGLAFYLGSVLLIESFRQSLLQRAWLDLIPALGIMAICLRYGHMTGVAAGLILASLLFSYSYAKLGPVRRHLTAASISSNVVRSKEHTSFLRREGHAIHIYWISGYLFFGSSDRLFENIRSGTDTQRDPKIAYIVLDMTDVSGMDSSAVLSLLKLKNFCGQKGTRLIFCGLGKPMTVRLEADAVLTEGGRDVVFTDRNEALAWCEASLLATMQGVQAQPSGEKLETWLSRELGQEFAIQIMPYLERKALKRGEVLYSQGDAAETIDLVVEGSIAVVLKHEGLGDYWLRVMKTQTIVGEMGFFRNALRTASILAAEDGVVYSLTREGFSRLEIESPTVASSFLKFVIRILADRVDFANHETAALL
ncbi:MAG: cyclic nucleotide-binding domain-containing protein [Rhodomicrobium sp.]